MKLVSKFNQINEKDAKQSYKELLSHIEGSKRSVIKNITDYSKDGKVGKLLIALGKDSDRKSIVDGLELLQHEFDKVNV